MIRQSMLMMLLAGVSAFAQAPAQQPAQQPAQGAAAGPAPRGIWKNIEAPPKRPAPQAERKPAAMPAQPATNAVAAAKPVVELPPDMLELHQRAVELMRTRKFAEAGPIMEKIAKAVPPEKRGRAFVINRAILDMGQKRFTMRAVKELGDYLIKNREEDEFATNVLAVALNVSARDAVVKRGALWQAAFTEWDRRNYTLDHSRPGYHRWGAKWLTEEENDELKAKKRDREDAIAAQYERVNRLYWNVGAKQREYNEQARATPTYGFGPYQGQQIPQPTTLAEQQAIQAQLNQQMLSQQYTQASLQRAADEVNAITREYEQSLVQLKRMEQQEILPEWPTGFDPIDATENVPPPPVLPEQPPKPVGNNPFAQPKP